MRREARAREAAARAAREAAEVARRAEEARQSEERHLRQEAMVVKHKGRIRLHGALVRVQNVTGCTGERYGYLVLPKRDDKPTGPGIAGATGRWFVVHLDSGLGVGPDPYSLNEARALAARLVPLADWTQPEDALADVRQTVSGVSADFQPRP